MVNFDSKIQQWKKRVIAMKFIYSQLIVNDEIHISKNKIAREYLDINGDFMRILEYFIDNKNDIINKISKYLTKEWNFDRLNYVDQAILIIAYIESIILKTDKATIIDQAIITAKKYSDVDAYKYINAILNKII